MKKKSPKSPPPPPPQNDFILEFAIKGKKTQILISILPGETLVLPTPWVSQYLH